MLQFTEQSLEVKNVWKNNACLLVSCLSASPSIGVWPNVADVLIFSAKMPFSVRAGEHGNSIVALSCLLLAAASNRLKLSAHTVHSCCVPSSVISIKANDDTFTPKHIFVLNTLFSRMVTSSSSSVSIYYYIKLIRTKWIVSTAKWAEWIFPLTGTVRKTELYRIALIVNRVSEIWAHHVCS